MFLLNHQKNQAFAVPFANSKRSKRCNHRLVPMTSAIFYWFRSLYSVVHYAHDSTIVDEKLSCCQKFIKSHHLFCARSWSWGWKRVAAYIIPKLCNTQESIVIHIFSHSHSVVKIKQELTWNTKICLHILTNAGKLAGKSGKMHVNLQFKNCSRTIQNTKPVDESFSARKCVCVWNVGCGGSGREQNAVNTSREAYKHFLNLFNSFDDNLLAGLLIMNDTQRHVWILSCSALNTTLGQDSVCVVFSCPRHGLHSVRKEASILFLKRDGKGSILCKKSRVTSWPRSMWKLPKREIPTK